MSANLNVLWASDGSDGSLAAVPLLRNLVLPAAASLTVLTVAPAPVASGARPDPVYLRPWTKEQKAEALEQALAVAQASAEQLDGSGDAIEVAAVFGHPIEQVLREADRRKADLIVIGAKGQSNLKMLLLGSVARGVVEYSRRPTLLVRPGRDTVDRAVIGVDDSKPSLQAVDFADRLLPAETAISLVTAAEFLNEKPTRYRATSNVFLEETRALNTELMTKAQTALDTAERRLTEAGRTVTAELRRGKPHREVLAAAAEQEADLIVVGSRPPSRAGNFLIGSVADAVVRDSPLPVLVVR